MPSEHNAIVPFKARPSAMVPYRKNVVLWHYERVMQARMGIAIVELERASQLLGRNDILGMLLCIRNITRMRLDLPRDFNWTMSFLLIMGTSTILGHREMLSREDAMATKKVIYDAQAVRQSTIAEEHKIESLMANLARHLRLYMEARRIEGYGPEVEKILLEMESGAQDPLLTPPDR